MVSKNQKKQNGRPNSFGAVSRINTAPVAVGNSVRGSKPHVTSTPNGARVCGRDFAFALSPTAAAVVDWELIGGMPITPCALPSSILRTYCQTYAKFKVNSLTVHYITSSPTSQAGDVLFYYEPSRNAPMVDYTDPSFLPFVLSDPNTIIGPQWTNHSATINGCRDWKTTLYGSSTDLDEDACGTVYMFSKTNAANSPGYVLIDYDITFKDLALNPKAGSYPIARAQLNEVALTLPATLISGNRAAFSINTGKNVANATSSAPTGDIPGDIYKLVFQTTSSTLLNTALVGTGTTPTYANLLDYGDGTDVPLRDGITFYALELSANSYVLHATYDQARANSNPIEWGINATVVSGSISAVIHLVSNVDSLQQSAY